MLKMFLAIPSMFWEAIKRWNKDDSPRVAAALAFYTGLSLAPLILFGWVVFNYFFDGVMIETGLIQQAENVIGEDGEQVVRTILQSKTSRGDLIATLVSLNVLLFSASNIFNQLQRALNEIWRVPSEQEKPILGYAWRRLKAIGMVLGMGLIFVALLVITFITSALRRFVEQIAPRLGEFTPGISEIQWRSLMLNTFPLIDLGVSLVLIFVVFIWLYRTVPRNKYVRWSDMILGAIVGSVLFTVGKYVLGWYVAGGRVGAAYGTAGSLLIVLIWFYYSGQIFLLGAQLTYVFAHRFGSHKLVVDHVVEE